MSLPTWFPPASPKTANAREVTRTKRQRALAAYSMRCDDLTFPEIGAVMSVSAARAWDMTQTGRRMFNKRTETLNACAQWLSRPEMMARWIFHYGSNPLKINRT